MRRNKLMAVALAGIMAAGALSGCTGSGSTTPTTAAESKKETEAAKTEAAGSGRLVHRGQFRLAGRDIPGNTGI